MKRRKKKLTIEEHRKLGTAMKRIELILIDEIWTELLRHYSKKHPMFTRWKKAHRGYCELQNFLDDLVWEEYPDQKDSHDIYFGHDERRNMGGRQESNLLSETVAPPFICSTKELQPLVNCGASM